MDAIQKKRQKKIVNLKYIYQENKERGAARNTGTLASSGEFVTHFDSDDLPNPNYFEVIQTKLKTQKPAWTAFACDKVIIADGEIVKKISFSARDFDLWRENYLGCQGVILRRDIALNYLFSEKRELSGLEDWELWLRIAKDHTLSWIPVPILSLRDHPERSMNSISPASFEQKISLLIEAIRITYRNDQQWTLNHNKFMASCNTFLAVHLASIANKKRYALSLLTAATILDPNVMRTKRFYATLFKLTKPTGRVK